MASNQNSVLLALALQRRYRRKKIITVTKKVNQSTERLISSYSGPNVEHEDDINETISKLSGDIPLIDAEDIEYAYETLEKSKEECISIFSIDDSRYPGSLKQLVNPPTLLHVKGDLGILDTLPGVAVVGTRKATTNGIKIAKRISSFLASEGWTIISGLAKGIDAASHTGALDVNGKTIAVLAHGLHKASPKHNEDLGKQILEKGGAWISEHAVGVEPMRSYFVPRNRIQIGLSVGSIIVEADLKSGSTSQANFCIENNRELFAVVPEDKSNILGLLSNGTEQLVNAKKAKPIMTKKDYPHLLNVLEKQKIAYLGNTNRSLDFKSPSP